MSEPYSVKCYLFHGSLRNKGAPDTSMEFVGTDEEIFLQMAFWFWANGTDPLDGSAMMARHGYVGANSWAARTPELLEAVRNRSFALPSSKESA